jgi:hypothetical protein
VSSAAADANIWIIHRSRTAKPGPDTSNLPPRGKNFYLSLVYITVQIGIVGREIPAAELRGKNMKCGLVVLFALILSAFIFSTPLLAHHSSAAFALGHEIALKGTVTNFEWTNPHVFIYLDVMADDSSVEAWRIEANSPNMLSRSGWKKEMVTVGDAVTVSGSPAKNKTKVMRLVSIMLANGQKYDGQGFK